MVTKLNVNIRTLLTNCEELSKDEQHFWRLKKYIKSLNIMIDELNEYNDPSNMENIQKYRKRLDVLKTITNYVETPKLPSKSAMLKQQSGTEAGSASLLEMRQLQSSKQYTDLRKELINEDQLRRRKTDAPTAGAETMNEAVKYYSDAQEKITEHMLSLTRNLKEQTETANRIIKNDTNIVSKSTGMADNNMSSLQKEATKLEDHSRNAWKCWMWMMIAFVVVVFIAMVLFMKIMKKKRI